MTTSTKALIGVLIAGAAGIVIFFFVGFSNDPKRPIKVGAVGTAKACAQTGDCLPDMPFIDTNGVAYTPEKLAGKVVVVNFWATWCGPCLKEIPDLSKIYDEHGKEGLVVLGVLSADNVDNQALLNFASDNMMSFPIIRETPEIKAAFSSPVNLPTTFVYDRKGNLVRWPGSRNTLGGHEGAIRAEKLLNFIAPLLAAK